MLVMSRKVSESIVINDDITVTVVALLKDRVRLGIETPKDVSVQRKELSEVNKEREPNELPRLDPRSVKSHLVDAVDRLAEMLSKKSQSQVSRVMVLEAILEAVEAQAESLSVATSLEDLKHLLIRRRH
jgi:carbon storage regulator